MSHHELQVVNDDMIDIVEIDSVLHGVQHGPAERSQSVAMDTKTITFNWGLIKMVISLDILLPVESHEVERELLKLVCPEVVLLQVVLKPLHGKLRQHDFSQTDVIDLKAAPQRVDALHAKIQGQLADKGGLPTASRTWLTKKR